MNSTAKKNWREFKIQVQSYPSRKNEDPERAKLRQLGIVPEDEDEDEQEPEYHKARVRFALEDVSDYYESFNPKTKQKGVFVNLEGGSAYFIIFDLDEFIKLRVELGIEEA